jgi:Protein of unknown function (DUF3923)
MKKMWVFWWMTNLFWVILFGVVSAFIWLRGVDGAGIVQTPEAKLVAFLILAAAFLFPAIIQGVWLVVNVVMQRKKTVL